MKTIDFSTGRVSQYKPLNEERVDEFLGAILIAGFGGMLASKAMLSWWSGIQELRTGIAKSKAERAKSKTEKMQERTKQLEEHKNRYQMLFGNAKEAAGPGAKDPDGNDMDELAAAFQRIAKGEATDKDIELVGKVGKRKSTKEENEVAGRVEAAAGKYTQEDIDKYCEEHGIPKNADPEVVGKMMDAHKAAMQKALPPKSENKTDDELRQEIKDKLKDAKEDEIPPSLKDKDGKLDVEKLDKATGDDLAGFAKDCGVETVKPQKPEGGEGETKPEDGKGETKPENGEGETKPEDNKDDNKVPYYDTDGNETGMYVVKKEDGSYEMQNEKGEKQEGDVDEKDFEEMKQVRDEKAKNEKPKPEGGEGETKPEDGAEGEEDDPTDGDERTDNDDKLDDPDMTSDFNIDTNHPKKDPSKVYKKRTYKRGNKTFTTKNYYNKHGIAITPDEYNNALKNWDKKKKKNEEKKKNEGWNITKLSSMKSTPVTESKATDRISITKERLVYIRYVMDTTTKSVEKVAMERMYNALFDLAFNADGTPRSLKELYSYLDQTMIENKGKVPGLPNETQIENIDEKVQAFKKLHTHEYDAYIKRLDKELLDKAGDKKDDDAAADLLHPAKDETDAKTIEDISKLSTVYGFTNILGLEPERKPNQKDDEAKAEISKQQKDGSPNANTKDSPDVKADEIPDEQIDKIIGVSK